MTHPYPTMDVSGTTPGADSNTDTMWSTTATVNGDRQYPKRFFSMQGFARARLSIDHSHNGTLKWYHSTDGGAKWTQVGSQAATAVANEATVVDILIEGEPDFKVEWTNGGTAQSPWSAYLTLSTDSSPVS